MKSTDNAVQIDGAPVRFADTLSGERYQTMAAFIAENPGVTPYDIAAQLNMTHRMARKMAEHIFLECAACPTCPVRLIITQRKIKRQPINHYEFRTKRHRR